MSLHLRAEIYRIMVPVGDPSGAKHAISLALVATILAAVFEAILATVSGIAQSCREIFRIVQSGTFGVFTLEYVARLWIAPVGSPANPHKALRAYALSFLGLVDLVVIAPFWFDVVARLPDSVLMMASLLSPSNSPGLSRALAFLSRSSGARLRAFWPASSR